MLPSHDTSNRYLGNEITQTKQEGKSKEGRSSSRGEEGRGPA